MGFLNNVIGDLTDTACMCTGEGCKYGDLTAEITNRFADMLMVNKSCSIAPLLNKLSHQRDDLKPDSRSTQTYCFSTVLSQGEFLVHTSLTHNLFFMMLPMDKLQIDGE